MDHIIAENKGTLSRDNQRKKTLISLYWQQKKEEADKKKFAPKPNNPLKCTDLKDAKRFLNEDVMAVNKLLGQLTEESLMTRMKKYASASNHKNRKKQKKNNNNKKVKYDQDETLLLDHSDEDENDEDEEEEPIDPQERQTQYNSVRILNNKLHDALILKDTWERRVQELELLTKHSDTVKTQQEAAKMVTEQYKNQVAPKNRRKGFFGAAQFLPEGIQNSKQLQAQKKEAIEKKKQQQRQRALSLEDDERDDSRRRQRDQDDDDFDDYDQQQNEDEEDDDDDLNSEGGDSVDDFLSGILPTSAQKNPGLNSNSASGRLDIPNLFASSLSLSLSDLAGTGNDCTTSITNIAPASGNTDGSDVPPPTSAEVSSSSKLMHSLFSELTKNQQKLLSSSEISKKGNDDDEQETVDPFHVDPSSIPSEDEIQKKLVEDKKARLRQRLLERKK